MYMHHEHHKLPGSGRETNSWFFCTPESAHTAQTPPPLPPSGSNPGHCQKVKNPRLSYWGRGGAEVCCKVFSCFFTCSSLFNIATTSQKQLQASFLSRGGIDWRHCIKVCGHTAGYSAVSTRGHLCLGVPYVITLMKMGRVSPIQPWECLRIWKWQEEMKCPFPHWCDAGS